MADKAPKQTDHRLEIQTVLDAVEQTAEYDPLLLVLVKGTEEISQPYAYSVKMWRFIDNEKHPPIPPGDLINTPAEIRFNVKQTVEIGQSRGGPQHMQTGQVGKDINTFVRRRGIFETFIDEGFVVAEGTHLVGGTNFRVRQYSATIVPAFRMMEYDNTFRVFEQKTVLEIIHEVTDSYPNFKIDDKAVKPAKGELPKIPYCVQYKESTFNFLNRLMAEYGIWYYFDHDKEPGKLALMVLGLGSPRMEACKTSGVPFDKDHPINQLTLLRNKGVDPSVLTIQNFQEIYNPIPRRVRFGNFNILNPTDPVSAAANIQSQRDLISPESTPVSKAKGSRSEPDDDVRFRTHGFGISVEQNEPPEVDVISGGDPPTNAPSAKAYVDAWIQGRDALVAKVSGSTRNPALVPGFTFDRVSSIHETRHRGDQENVVGQEDRAASQAGADSLVFQNLGITDQPKTILNTYVIHRLELDAAESSYANDSGDLIKFIINTMFPTTPSVFDILANGGSQGMNNYLQNQLPLNFGQPPSGPAYQVMPFVLGGGFAVVTGAIPLLVQALEKFGDQQTDDFRCSFVAIPTAKIEYSGDRIAKTNAPLPSFSLPSTWVKPSVAGPHLAVVIGEKGINAQTERGQVYADKLGRVRIRFPWDRKEKEKPGDAFKRGDATCWVRVSEGWAGRGFGTQFLPRIGQEVIVDFIDGDPDRPLITGRVYNADHQYTNLPFPHGTEQKQSVKLNDVLDPAHFEDFRFNGIKTRSMPLDVTDDRFHLLRFDDTKDKEQYLIRSQRRLDITALEKRYESISSDRHLTVGGIDPKTHAIGGTYFAKAFKDYHLHVGDPQNPFQSGNRNTKLEAAESLAVGQSSDETIGGNWAVSVGGGPTLGGQISMSALAGTGVISLSAMTNITLMCGASILVMTPAGVSITAPVINLVGPVLGPSPMMGPSPVPLPPMPAIPAMPVAPQDPTPADPGDKLTPPKE